MQNREPAEAILSACFRSFAALPNAELIEDDDVFGVLTDIPLTFFNGIVPMRPLTGDLDAIVTRATAPFRTRRRPFRWWVSPITAPPELAPTLTAHGLRHPWDALAMSADLTSMSLDVTLAPGVAPPPPGLAIRRVRNLDELHPWTDIFLEGFHLPPEARDAWLAGFGALGFDETGPWCHFVGYLDGSPIASTTLLVTGPLAGIYHVVTLPPARGRGVGSAVMRAALTHAGTLGATEVALQASDMAVTLYRTLGFTDAYNLSMFDWRP